MGIMYAAVLSLLLLCGQAADDDSGWVTSAVLLSGAGCVEDLDDDEFERFRRWHEHPLAINCAPRSRLLSSGLFTSYQAASLYEYMSENGDVLSVYELAAVDGFGQSRAMALQPFLSFESRNPSGSRSSPRLSVDAALRSGVKLAEKYGERGVSPSWNYGTSSTVAWGDNHEIGFALSHGYEGRHFPPENLSFHACSGGRDWKIIAGDFNLRFGQGLTLWSGLMLNELNNTSSFTRGATGVSPYRGYAGSGTHRGLAGDVSWGRWKLSAALSLPGLRERMGGSKKVVSFMPVANISAYGRVWSAGLTLCAEAKAGDRVPDRLCCGSDFMLNLRGTDLFGEVGVDALSGTVSAMLGARATLSEKVKAAVRGAYERGGEHSANAALDFGSGYDRHSGTLSFSASCKPGLKRLQFKSTATFTANFGSAVSLKMRGVYRYRNWDQPHYADLRADLGCDWGKWLLGARLNGHYCGSFSGLTYVEAGWKPLPSLSLHLRQGGFLVDSWDSRIYVYERDAPGSFNVPAMYGRGLWTSLYVCARFGRWGKFYLRASTTRYPGQKPGASVLRDPKSELKFSLVLTW